MSSDPVTLHTADLRAPGLPARKIVEKVVPDSGDRQGLRPRYDLWVARRAMELLERAYPGHHWMVEADCAKGIMTVSLPVLMGGSWVYLIKHRRVGKGAKRRAHVSNQSSESMHPQISDH